MLDNICDLWLFTHVVVVVAVGVEAEAGGDEGAAAGAAWAVGEEGDDDSGVRSMPIRFKNLLRTVG